MKDHPVTDTQTPATPTSEIPTPDMVPEHRRRPGTPNPFVLYYRIRL